MGFFQVLGQTISRGADAFSHDIQRGISGARHVGETAVGEVVHDVKAVYSDAKGAVVAVANAGAGAVKTVYSDAKGAIVHTDRFVEKNLPTAFAAGTGVVNFLGKEVDDTRQKELAIAGQLAKSPGTLAAGATAGVTIPLIIAGVAGLAYLKLTTPL